MLNGGQPLHHDAFFLGLHDFRIVGGGAVAGPAIHDDGFLGTQAFRGTSRIHGRVPATVNDDAASQHRFLVAFHVGQHIHRVHDFRGIPGGNVGVTPHLGSDSQEHGVKIAGDIGHVLYLRVELESDPHVGDTFHFLIQDAARQPVGGNPEPHHASRHRTGVAYRDGVAHPAQMVGGGKPGGARPYDQHFLAAFRG